MKVLRSPRTRKETLHITPHVYVSKRREIQSTWCTAHAQRRQHAATRTAEPSTGRIGEEAQAGGVGKGTPRPLQHFRKSLPCPQFHFNSINKLERAPSVLSEWAQKEADAVQHAQHFSSLLPSPRGSVPGAARPAASRGRSPMPRWGSCRRGERSQVAHFRSGVLREFR